MKTSGQVEFLQARLASSEASLRWSHPSPRTGHVQNGTALVRFPGVRARRASPRAPSAGVQVPAHNPIDESITPLRQETVENTTVRMRIVRGLDSQAQAWLARLSAAIEQYTMHSRAVLATAACIASVHAFVAPSRSVARPSSSHAQPTAPAAMRQQTQQAVHESRRRGTSRITHEPHAIDATTTRWRGARLTRQRPRTGN